MTEPMTVRVEIWPVAADEFGLWLVSGADAWRPALPLMADGDPHAEVQLGLAEHSAEQDLILLHSTSWHVDGPTVILSYVAALRVDGLVRDRWPTARPLSRDLAEAVGPPPTHGPIDPPTPRYIDVLMHAVRSLRFLIAVDATAAAALDHEEFRRHLDMLEPALAGMYARKHELA